MTETLPVATGSRPASLPTTLRSLTGLRFLAALLVFFFHTGLSQNPIALTSPGGLTPFADETVAHWYAALFTNGGFVGVSIFFVLSGFVLSWSYRPEQPARGFIRRRLVKVFPNHVVMWAICMLLFAGATTPWTAWLPNLFLVHTWFPNLYTALGVNMPAWSLCSELLFYVCLPFLVRPIARMGGRALWISAGLTVLALVVYQLVVLKVVSPEPGSGVAVAPDMQFWLGYIAPFGRMFEFLLGAILAYVVRAGNWPRIGVVPAFAFAVLGYAVNQFAPQQFTFNVVMLVPIGVLVASLADADVRGARTGFGARLFVWFGEVSFGFYLVQSVTIFYLRELTNGVRFSTPIGVLVLIGLFAITLLGGWLLHTFVEMPMMRRFSRARTRPAPAPSLAT